MIKHNAGEKYLLILISIPCLIKRSHSKYSSWDNDTLGTC